jgi:hypothetical protein
MTPRLVLRFVNSCTCWLVDIPVHKAARQVVQQSRIVGRRASTENLHIDRRRKATSQLNMMALLSIFSWVPCLVASRTALETTRSSPRKYLDPSVDCNTKISPGVLSTIVRSSIPSSVPSSLPVYSKHESENKLLATTTADVHFPSFSVAWIILKILF